MKFLVRVGFIPKKRVDNMIRRAWLFLKLYVYSVYKSFIKGKQVAPEGIRGEKLFLFFDPQHPKRKHGVVAFVLSPGTKTEEFSDDLFGPFGYTSQINLNGLHLYGRDTWGTIQDYQIPANPILQIIRQRYSQHTIVLAGVRPLVWFHPYPLIASKFILVRK